VIILGVDPGTRVTGYGLVSGEVSRPECLGYGSINTSPKAALPVRLKHIFDGLLDVIEKTKPDHMAIEEAFFAKNAQSALKLGMARGVIMLAAVQSGLEVFEYSPLLIKQTVSGYGRADKEQVRDMLKIQLRLVQAPDPMDASDALAVALTHLIHFKSPVARMGAKR